MYDNPEIIIQIIENPNHDTIKDNRKINANFVLFIKILFREFIIVLYIVFYLISLNAKISLLSVFSNVKV